MRYPYKRQLSIKDEMLIIAAGLGVNLVSIGGTASLTEEFYDLGREEASRTLQKNKYDEVPVSDLIDGAYMVAMNGGEPYSFWY